MLNLSNIVDVATAAKSLGGIILVTPNVNKGIQPQNSSTNVADQNQQQKTILFDYEGENSVTLKSDITDHYSENNESLQDQIALQPTIISTQGYIGELNDVVPDLLAPIKAVADRLGPLSAYTPALSETAIIAYNQAKTAYDIAMLLRTVAVSAWGTSDNQNKQQKKYQEFQGYWKNRTLFTVQTPWAIYKNMAIDELRAVQDPDTRVLTTFEVRFKEIRFATTRVLNSMQFQGRSAAQSSEQVNNGVSTPSNTSFSFGDKILGAFPR